MFYEQMKVIVNYLVSITDTRQNISEMQNILDAIKPLEEYDFYIFKYLLKKSNYNNEVNINAITNFIFLFESLPGGLRIKRRLTQSLQSLKLAYEAVL
jgi:hypothetical protein